MKLKIINGLMFGVVLYLLIDKYRKKKDCKCEDKTSVMPTPDKKNETVPKVATDPILESTNVIETVSSPTPKPVIEKQSTAIPPPAKPLLYSKSLGWAINKEGVCSSPSYSNKWMDGASFGSSSKLFNDSNGEKLASSGYYTDGNYWRYWDASAQTFNFSGGCYGG